MRAPIRLALTSLLAAALAAGVPAVPAAGLNDTDALRARARSLAARVSSLEHRLARARAERSRLLGAIDETSRRIAVLDAERLETQERFQQVQQELVARAIEAYKNGPATTLTLLLSTDSLGELYDVAQAAAAAAGSDRDVLNRLLQAKTADERLEARSERRKAILVAERRELEQTIARMRRLLTGRRQALGACTRGSMPWSARPGRRQPPGRTPRGR
jgi:peptidoglycan hydrolase CwlO-like protein